MTYIKGERVLTEDAVQIEVHPGKDLVLSISAHAFTCKVFLTHTEANDLIACIRQAIKDSKK